MNVASKWDLPLLIVQENNRYAQSTPQSQTLAGDIEARAAAFGIDTASADTWNPAGLLATTATAIESIRVQGRPFFLRVDTYRLMAHSKGDDDRDQAEVRSYWDRDPITLFARDEPEAAERLEAEAKTTIDAAVTFAEGSPFADVGPPEWTIPTGVPSWEPTLIENPGRVVAAIHDSLQRNMARDERIVIIGEDIEGPYGGAFKVTKNLSLRVPRAGPQHADRRVGHRRPGQRPGPERDDPGLRDHVRRLHRPRRRPDHQPRGQVQVHV